MRLIAMNLLLGLTIWPATLSAQTLPAPSTWKNARGSVLTISGVDSEGKVTGTFVNNAPGTQCIGRPYEATGKVSAGRVRLAVVFTECRTVTVWRGRVAGTQFPTRFEAAYPTQNGRIEIWRGRDNFVKQP